MSNCRRFNNDIEGLIQIYNSGGMGLFRCKQLIDLLLKEREHLNIKVKEYYKSKYEGNEELWKNDGCPEY